MSEAWLGAVLVLLVVLGVVRCVAAWLIYQEFQRQRNEWMKLPAKANSALMKYDNRPLQRSSRHARRSRRREFHVARWDGRQSGRFVR